MKKRRLFAVCQSQNVHRRGAMLVLVALLITVFLAAVAFAVDVAYMQNVRTELRIATDAAARAAGEALSREQDLASACQAAKDLAALHEVCGKPLMLDDTDVIPGNSSREGGQKWIFTPYGTPTNSIRVIGPRTRDSLSGSVPLFFARIFSVDDFSAEMTATAVRMDRDICIVVDRSSSMKLDVTSNAVGIGTGNPIFCRPPDPEDSRWAALATAVDGFVAALASTPQTEHVALVSYASDYTGCGITNHVTDVDQDLTPDTTLINSAMQSISARAFNGNTNIAAGIDTGVLVLTNPSRARPYSVKTMVLMTDGQRTEGRQPVLGAEDAALEGIVIHTITFGHGADIPSMQEVARATGGRHYHAPNADALRDIFREIAYTISVTLTE
jgi:Ca-activated chloride channel family protein